MRTKLLCVLTALLLTASLFAQQRESAVGVPSQVRFSGTLAANAGSPRVGTAAVVFALYQQQKGGAPLWVETQNVQLDGQGRYTVNLGAVNALPKDVFSANEARWLGVQVLADAEPEQPRVMLVSVPYALKAQDAETLGGRPASAYLLAESVGPATGSGGKGGKTGSAAALEIDGNVVTVDPHTVNAIPKFTATDTLDDSLMYETYNQAAVDAFGLPLAGNEDVVNIGDGTGLRKRLNVVGRVTAQAFDINSSALANSFRVVNDHPDARAMQANARDGGNGFTAGLFASAKSNNAVGVYAYAFPPDVVNAPGEYAAAVYAGNYNSEGPGVVAWSAYNGTPGGDTDPLLSGPMGLYAAVAHSTGIAAVLDYRNTGTAKLLSARNNGTEVASMNSAGNLTTTGTITAASFSGDGSALTNVTGVGSLASDPAACGANNFVTDIAADGTLTCAQPSSSNLSDVANLATTSSVTALAAPQYVTLAASGDLANERVLTAGKGIAITDGGAGAAVTIHNKAEFAQTSVQAGDEYNSSYSAGAEFATTYTIPANTLTQGMVIEVWAFGLQSAGSSGNSFGYGVKFGSTTVVPGEAGLFMSATSFSNPWQLTARIIVTSVSGSTATLEAQGTQISATSGGASASYASRNNFNTTTVIVDPTVSQELKIYQGITGNDAASAFKDTMSMRQLIVKILK